MEGSLKSLGRQQWELSPPLSNHMNSILVNVKDRLCKGYGTGALTRIHGGENET